MQAGRAIVLPEAHMLLIVESGLELVVRGFDCHLSFGLAASAILRFKILEIFGFSLVFGCTKK